MVVGYVSFFAFVINLQLRKTRLIDRAQLVCVIVNSIDKDVGIATIPILRISHFKFKVKSRVLGFSSV